MKSLFSKKISAAFLTTALSLPFAPSYAQDLPIIVPPITDFPSGNTTTSQPVQDDELARAIYRDQLIQTWLKDPEYYQAMKDVADNPVAATEWKNRFSQQDQVDVEMNSFVTTSAGLEVPLGDVTGIKMGMSADLDSREKRLYNYTKVQAAEDTQARANMTAEWNDVERLAERYTDAAYAKQNTGSAGNHEYMVDFLDQQIKSRTGAYLDPSDYETLMQRIDAPSDALAKIGITADEARRVAAGEITLEDLAAGRGTTPQALRQEIENNYFQNVEVVFNNITVLQQPDTSTYSSDEKAELASRMAEIDHALENTAFTEDQAREIGLYREAIETRLKTIKLQEHETTVTEARSYNQALNSVTALLFPESQELQDAGSIVAAGIDLYDSMGSMLINGAIDPSGVSMALGAVNVISSVFGGRSKGPSAEVKLLRQVLENQRKMMEMLNQINQRVAVLDNKIDQIRTALEQLETAVDYGFFNTLLAIDALDIRAAQREQIFAKEMFVENDKADIDKTMVDFRNAQGSQYDSAIVCLATNECDADAKILFRDIQQQASVLFTRATQTLIDSETFTRPQGYLTMRSDLLADHFSDEIENAVGDVDDMGQWVNNKATQYGLLVEGSITPHHRVNVAALSNIPHPYYLTEVYIPSYVNLVTHLPTDNQAADTPDVDDMNAVLEKVTIAAEEMRESIYTALYTYSYAMTDLTLITNKFFDNDAPFSEGNYFNSAFYKYPDFKNVFFNGSDDEIRTYLKTLNNMDFRRLGWLLDVFQASDGIRDHTPDKNPDTLPLNETYDAYLQLSPMIKATLNLQQMNDRYLIRQGDRHNEGETIVDSGTDIPFPPQVQDILVNIIVDYVHVSRDRGLELWKSKLSSTQTLRDDVANSAFITQSFLKGGYGSCLDYDPGLAWARDLVGTMHLSTAALRPLTEPLNWQELNQALNNFRTAKGSIPHDITWASLQNCSLGWGNIPRAQAAMDKLRMYSPKYVP